MTTPSLSELFKTKRVLSFELFPPKTEKGEAALYQHVEALLKFTPDFFTCTYGAGGSTQQNYFRIFNPFSQSKRFDVDGKFIKAMCPELEPVPAKALHDLKKLSAAIKTYQLDYPDYIVDYSAGRQRALAAFKGLST